MKKLYALITILFLTIASQAQPEGAWMHAPYLTVNGAQDEWKQTNFYEIQKAFNAYEKDWERTHPTPVNLRVDYENPEDEENEMPGRLQFRRWESYMEARVFPTGDLNEYDSRIKEMVKERAELRNEESSSAANWVSIGPFNDTYSMTSPSIGRTSFLKVHPTNSNILFAGAATGGLWKSTDAGATWTTLTDNAYLFLGTSDLVFDPSNPNIMYLATGDCDNRYNSIGILKSTNGGNTWSTTGLTYSSGNDRIYKLLIHPSNGNILFAATDGGLHKSTDAGTTWTLDPTIGTASVQDVKFKPTDPSIVYVVGTNGYWRSTNGGTNFTAISTSMPNANRKCIGVTAANPSYIYVLTAYNDFQGLFRSTDNGLTFTTQSTSPNIAGGQGTYDLAMVVNPTNANEVYAGGVTAWKSIDGGVTWNVIDGGHADMHCLEWLPGSSTTFFIASDGGIAKSVSGNPGATALVSGMACGQVYSIATSATNTDVMISGEQDNGMKVRTAAGWRQVEQGDFVGGAIDHNNFDIQYWIEHNGKIRKTTNGTSATPTVTQIMNSGGSDYNSSGLWTTPMDLHPTDPNTLIVGKYKVWRTTDGGTTWDSIPGSSSSTAFKSIVYAPSNPNYIYASINFLSIYICTNGNTFVQRNTPWNIVNGFAVSYTNPQKVWAAMGISSGSNGVYYSNDAGLTWTNYSTGLPNYYMNQIVYQNGSNDGLYLASDIGVYYRDASMTSWIPFSNGLPNTQVTDLKIDYLSGKLRASTYGRGIWETNLYTTGINELNKSEESISIYPNPAKDNVTITINNQQSIHKNELSIYNVVGEKVFSETLTSNVEKLNVEKFSAGVYFVKVIDGEKTFTQKLIIQ